MPKSKVAEPYDMKEKDIEFLVTCLRNTIGSPLIIDAAKVAKEMNFGNTRSVGNKMSILKKKYGFEKVITITGASKSVPTTSTTSTAPSAQPQPHQSPKTHLQLCQRPIRARPLTAKLIRLKRLLQVSLPRDLLLRRLKSRPRLRPMKMRGCMTLLSMSTRLWTKHCVNFCIAISHPHEENLIGFS